jgi:bisphosphoglycerate-dependent phosphoglycerate mutase
MSDAFLFIRPGFIRHGETDYNRRGLRCGGDIGIPLTDTGADQAKAAAEQLLVDGLRPDAIFVSPLRRTRQTADILANILGFTDSLIPHEGLRERRLGAWNGQPIAETQAWFDAKLTPHVLTAIMLEARSFCGTRLSSASGISPLTAASSPALNSRNRKGRPRL